MTKLSLPTSYAVGERVTWREGQRERSGTVEAVIEVTGWPATYDVRPLRRDGTPGAGLRHLYHSQLNPPAPGQSEALPPDEVRRRLAEIQQQLRRRP